MEKNSRIAQRQLALVLHQSRLLVPQDRGPMPIELDREYSFDLDDPDLVDMAIVPDFPASREEAIQMAKRQRVEVRILVVGLRIAHLRSRGAGLRLFGTGGVPAELSFKNTTAVNHGVALGAIFGATYNPPLVDVDLWSRIRQARLDVIQSQLDLEKSLVDMANDAGNTWDRWQQAIKEWEQREAELALRREYLDRQERLYQQKQSIRLDVLGARVDLLQGRCQPLDGLVQPPVGPPRHPARNRTPARLCGEGGDHAASDGARRPASGLLETTARLVDGGQTRRPVHPEQGGDEPWSV